MGLLSRLTVKNKTKVFMQNNSKQIKADIKYCNISYSNEQKAINYFIKGVWSKIYFQYQDLNEMRTHLQILINRELVYANNSLRVEGLNLFYKVSDSTWVSENEKYGQIAVSFSDDDCKLD